MKNHLTSRPQMYTSVPATLSEPVNHYNTTRPLYAVFPTTAHTQELSALLVPHTHFRDMQAQQDLVAHKAFTVSRMIACYALDLPDDGLCEAITVSRTELQQVKPQHLIMIAAKLLAKAHTLLDDLYPYGLTSDQLADLEGDIKRLVQLCQSCSQA